MATRRDARERALQVLFQIDLNPGEVDRVLEGFWRNSEVPAESKRYTETLVRGVREKLGEIDDLIRKYAENWDIQRMAVVDRNVIRMSLFEMLHRTDVPPVVSINEAVDIVKYFSSAESGRFVNGILDRARKELARPPRTAARKRKKQAPGKPSSD